MLNEYEHCGNCGREYRYTWRSPNNLWNNLIGEHGLRCLDCFDKLAQEKGHFLVWGVIEKL